MKFDYSDVWDDTVRMLRANSSLLTAIAGAFFLLPALFLAFLAPEQAAATETLAQMIADMQEYYRTNWPWLLLANLINMVGAIAIYLLLFNAGEITVGRALGAALGFLPFYFLVSVLTGLIIGFGMSWFILPGVYLLGRVLVASAVMVAEGRRSPFAAIGRAWALARGKGWAIAFFIIIVAILAYLVIMAITFVFGSVFLLALGRDNGGTLLTTLLAAMLSAGFSTLMTVLFAAIYRRIGGAPALQPSVVGALD